VLIPYTDLKLFPIRGGCITSRDKAQLRFGEFSWAQNVRGDHPGLRKRKGQSQLHTTAITGAPGVVSLYQYRSVRGSHQKIFAQLTNDDLWMQGASVNVPDQYAGAFGALFHTGSAGTIPASFSTVKDHMLYSNGVDQHQLYCGPGSLIDRFIVYKETTAPPAIPEEGYDYSTEARDQVNTAKFADLDGIQPYATNPHCIFIKTKVPAKELAFVMKTANDAASGTAVLYYWNGASAAWTAASDFVDGTNDSTRTFGQSGSMTWTSPGAAEQEKYMFGENGFWYQIRIVTTAISNADVASVTFDDGGPQPLRNIWDGNDVYCVEAQFYDNTNANYEIYGAAAIDVGSMGTSDKLYVACADKIEALYIDPGSIPNTPTTQAITIKYWDGTQFATVGTVVDGTNGLANAGWVTFARKAAQPTDFNHSKYRAYWYEITFSEALDASMNIAISYMPYFDISEFGSSGFTNCVWKDRACYSFNQYGPYVYVSNTGRPMVLNGNDYGILKAGDGRYNPIKCQKKFVNELMVWQEEIGNEGGCITLFEGYSPTNFGKLVLSSKIGTMNAKSAVVVDGIMTKTETDARIKTLAFFLSRYGVYVTDGRTVSPVSGDINNYFDPQNSECINITYKNEMWIGHDAAENVLRMGLVTSSPRSTGETSATTADKLVDSTADFSTDGVRVGDIVLNTTDSTTALVTAIDSGTTLSLDTDIMTSGEGYEIRATKPNVFPVFDLEDKTFSFDTPAQSLSCTTEVSSDSGADEARVSTVQLGGGDDDGFVYRLNHGVNDYNGATETAINAYVDVELNADGQYFILNEMAIRVKAQTAGDVSLSLYKNGNLVSTKTLAMQAQNSGESSRRHRFYLDIKGDNLTVRLANAVADQSMNTYDVGLKADLWGET